MSATAEPPRPSAPPAHRGPTHQQLTPVVDQASRLRDLIRGGSGATETRPPIPLPAPVRRPLPRTQPQRPARTIGIASGKGGVGKTNIAVNLSIAFAGRGLRVTLLDADLGTANADVLCGLNPAARLEHAMAGSSPGGLRSICVDAPGGFRLVPGSAGVASVANMHEMERSQLVASLAELESEADLIVIDTGAGIAPGVTEFLHASDLAIVVATPEPTAIADAYALIKCLHTEGRDGGGVSALQDNRIALVVNQVVSQSEAAAVHSRISSVCDRFLGARLPLLGGVLRDHSVPESVIRRSPLLVSNPRSPAALNIQDTALKVLQHLGCPYRVDRGVGGTSVRCGLFSRLWMARRSLVAGFF